MAYRAIGIGDTPLLDPNAFNPNARGLGGGGGVSFVQPGATGYDRRNASAWQSDPLFSSPASGGGLELPGSFYTGGTGGLTIGTGAAGFQSGFGNYSPLAPDITGVGSGSGGILSQPVPNLQGGNRGTAGAGFPMLGSGAPGAGTSWTDTAKGALDTTARSLPGIGPLYAASQTDAGKQLASGDISGAASKVGASIVSAAGSAFGAWWQSWFARIFLIILGILLIFVALYFLMPDKAKSAVVTAATAGRIRK